MIENYQEIFDSLIGCTEENCTKCTDLCECLHYLREILALLIKDKIDYIFTQPNYIQEHLARDLCLQYLKIMDMDFIWLVDGDEFYSLEDIKNISSYIKENDFIWYSINF